MRPFIVAVTGGIGTGKTTVVREFARLGARTLSCDGIGHRLLLSGQPGFRPVVKAFGPGILGRDGEIERPRLAAIVFRSKTRLESLERILHPMIRAEAQRQTARKRRGVVVVDVPLLFEGKLLRRFDLSLAVASSRAQQIERLKRRGFSRADALRRLRMQLPLEEGVRRADLVLDNTGDLMGLREKIRTLYRAFALIANGRNRPLALSAQGTGSRSCTRR